MLEANADLKLAEQGIEIIREKIGQAMTSEESLSLLDQFNRLNQLIPSLRSAAAAAQQNYNAAAVAAAASLAARSRLLGIAGRAGLYGGSFVLGWFGGIALGNLEVDSASAVTLNDGVQELVLPFWQWWYGVKTE
jgi:hypothetical protein